MNPSNPLKAKQAGAALMVFVFMIALAFTAYLLKAYDPATLRAEQDKKTMQALAKAKQALLTYAAETITGAVNGAALACGLNCPRPGDLPCPDKDNDGDADPPCSSPASRLGRLPWKTLGLGDLRDGSGERLWYAVSTQYKNNPRILPLNSESFGTISSRNNAGILINSALLESGLAAVIIAPNAVLTREDNVVQNRIITNQNNAQHFLDIAFGEDNASFADGTTDGFVSGKVTVAGKLIVNDVLLPITRNDMNVVMESRVLSEVMQAVLYAFCPGRSNVKNRTCTAPTINDYLPDPANINDLTCLGNAQIDTLNCMTDSTQTLGRIAVGGNTSATGANGWKTQDSNSILRGDAIDNWFQQNGWRALIMYSRAPACTQTTKSCTGTGFLTLQNSLTPKIAPSANNKQAVFISAGSLLFGQSRTTNADKSNFANYLEAENLALPDTIFSRYRFVAGVNDKVISIP